MPFYVGEYRILVWRDGYYNGAIKTRKTVQSTEVSTEEASLHRSEQLRELYETLSSADETSHQLRRPSAALSPEDLTETEWYYLMCVSFSFPPDVGYVNIRLNIKQTFPWDRLSKTGQHYVMFVLVVYRKRCSPERWMIMTILIWFYLALVRNL